MIGLGWPISMESLVALVTLDSMAESGALLSARISDSHLFSMPQDLGGISGSTMATGRAQALIEHQHGRLPTKENN